MLGDIIGGIGNIIGGIMGRDSAEDMATRNMQMQKKFAQEGIQWKVEDAKKAGVHPLYALGAQTTAFSPISMNDPLPAAISEASNSFGRAINSTATAPQKAAQIKLMDLQIRRAELENKSLEMDILNSQKKMLTQPGTAVSIPTDGVVSSAPPKSDGFAADPRVALVTPPDPKVDVIKSFGYPLIRNPRLFGSGQKFSDEFGDEGPQQWIHNGASYIEAMSRAMYVDAMEQLRAARARSQRMPRNLYQYWKGR